MWETASARLTHAGLGKAIRGSPIVLRLQQRQLFVYETFFKGNEGAIELSYLLLCSPLSPKTKILAGWTSLSEWVFEALFNDSSPKYSTLSLLESTSKTHSEKLVRPSKIFVWEGQLSPYVFLPEA